MANVVSDGLAVLCAMIVMRGLPFAAFALKNGPSGARRSVAPLLVAFAAGTLVALGHVEAATWALVGLVYYASLCCAMPWLAGLFGRGALTRGALFSGLCIALLLMPGLALPGLAMASFLAVGWDLTLSSYSYCVETSRMPATARPLAPCLFFLLVNPTLLYTQQGAPAAQPPAARAALGRAALGILVFALGAILIAPALQALRVVGLPFWPGFGYATLLAIGALAFLGEYAAHSGLASLHIGLMRLSGWNVPERYDYPLLSTSPMDFWRRWNIYVRVWLEAYVFLPLSLAAARRTRSRVAQVAVAVIALLACGLLHDAYVFAGIQKATLQVTALFLLGGLLLAGWRIAGALTARLGPRLGWPHGRAWGLLTGLMPRVCMAIVLVGVSFVWSQR